MKAKGTDIEGGGTGTGAREGRENAAHEGRLVLL